MSDTRSNRPVPTKGAVLFFEGYEYEFEGIDEKTGSYTFKRPEGGDARYRRVSISPDEAAKSTAAELAKAAGIESADWLRRVPPALPKLAAAAPAKVRKAHEQVTALRRDFIQRSQDHAAHARGKLEAAGQKQYFHIAADPEDDFGHRPLRIIAPPIEHATLPLPQLQKLRAARQKAAAANGEPTAPVASTLGTLSITQSEPPASGKDEG